MFVVAYGLCTLHIAYTMNFVSGDNIINVIVQPTEYESNDGFHELVYLLLMDEFCILHCVQSKCSMLPLVLRWFYEILKSKVNIK